MSVSESDFLGSESLKVVKADKVRRKVGGVAFNMRKSLLKFKIAQSVVTPLLPPHAS